MNVASSVVLTPERLADEVQYFLQQDAFAFDYETVGGAHRGVPQVNQILWMSMATHGRTIVIPMGHPNGDVMVEGPRRKKNPDTNKFVMTPARWDAPPAQMRPAEVFSMLEVLFFDPKIEKVGHGSLFDFLSQVKYFRETVPGPYHCTLVQAWLLNENQRLGLKEITKNRYSRDYDAEHVGRKVEVHPFSKVAHYAYMDAKYTWLAHLDNMRALEEADLLGVYALEQDVFKVLLKIGATGTHVDVDRMQSLEETLAIRQVEIEGKVYKAAGQKFNLNSNPQKVHIFYGPKSEGGQGLKPWKLTKGGLKKREEGLAIKVTDYSTDAESLERYTHNPVVSAFLDYQEVARVLGTYIHGYLGEEGNPDKPGQIFDGKVYPEFVQYGTVTGRFSCRQPNLQNIPRPGTELGTAVRSLFIPGEGHKLVVADYGQVELVVLAHFVGRGAMYDGFHQGIDPHTMTAALVFNQDPVELTTRIAAKDPEAVGWRQIAKNLNFAIVYGAGPDKVASMSKITVARAKQILAKHERQFPEIYQFKDDVINMCRSRKPPHLVTLEGRKRRLPAIMSREFKIRGSAERKAVNSLIQGSAADLIKVAMVRVNDLFEEAGVGEILLTVHDELVCRAPEDKVDLVAALLREGMTGDGIQRMVDVPLSIDLNIVDNWASAK